ncbi:cryptochrome/photolyase family protein [Chthonobacter rhizosphaerae]|uniref:cryptochrome/photolyase family protein n=1 Tax=Chthonobacter rhizosphaerae TaxID=2735553 RepID=UPI0015EFA4AB|nr:cryptochrome/photolyase family protein [Chthonobacter rhizosphaerae]
MTTLRFILGDQLTREISSLSDLDPATDVVLMAEVADETTYVGHHKQKIAFVLSAMRHFANRLREEGIRVDYVRLDTPDNAGSFSAEIARAVSRHRPTRIVVTEPGEWRVLEAMRGWEDLVGVPVEIRDDDRFFASRARFRRWAGHRGTYRMEFFYREMRRETGLLMDGDEPAGGQWNYDHDNRKSLPAGLGIPARERFPPDPVTAEVLDLVRRRFPHHFGDLEPFGWAVTRDNALKALDHFVRHCLARFGAYQDAMAEGEPFLFHSLLSPYLNVGLLTPREVCAAAEAAWREGRAPLNAVEGFIRQILGWREYVRGIYWLRMPDYADSNILSAHRPLPWFYWSGETEMNCLSQVIGDIRRTGYGHHIQRLMVTGNFALLAGIEPAEIEAWYLAVYVDAYEWVELPNVHGMVLFADGGLLASKPYAASGAYIDRMSDYCAGCAYRPDVKTGEGACPFNYLYWNFLIENERILSRNPRMAMPYRTLARFSAERRAEIRRDAETFLDGLEVGDRVAT